MDPARMFKESLTSRTELENSQGQSRCLDPLPAISGLPGTSITVTLSPSAILNRLTCIIGPASISFKSER